MNGGTIDGDATVNITAANFSVGGQLDVFIDNRKNGSGSGNGGTIGGNAAINLNLSGNLTTTEAILTVVVFRVTRTSKSSITAAFPGRFHRRRCRH